MPSRLLLALSLAFSVVAAPAAASDYYASRFDSNIVVRDDGSLLVTETIVFTFEDGTFKKVFRTIPTRRTDGIEFVSAAMDGRQLQPGTGAGQVEVRRKDGVRIEWHFAPLSASTHAFELVYVARGVVRQEAGYDLLAWRALPTEHEYRIDRSTIEIRTGATPIQTDLNSRRVIGEPQVAPFDGGIRIHATEIRRNGWIEPNVRFDAGALVAAPPRWQQRQRTQAEKAPVWLAIGGGILAVGLVLLVGLRQSYDAPVRSTATAWTSVLPPDHLSPAIAGALVANGRVQLEHAMAALFGLAERGVVSIQEEPRGTFGTRSFVIGRRAGPSHLAPHETALLDVIFRQHGADQGVPLSKARTALQRHWKVFRSAVDQELLAAGLSDRGRQAHRRRYTKIGLGMLIPAALGFAACVPFVDDYAAWPMLIPLALLLVALSSFIFGAAETPLSNEGVRRSDAWRGYQKHLKAPQDIEPRWGASASAEARILPYAVALGLAAAWSKFMKRRNVQLPGWFHPASSSDSGPAFAAFIATGGAGSHGGGPGAGGGGAAGGGSSGAG